MPHIGEPRKKLFVHCQTLKPHMRTGNFPIWLNVLCWTNYLPGAEHWNRICALAPVPMVKCTMSKKLFVQCQTLKPHMRTGNFPVRLNVLCWKNYLPGGKHWNRICPLAPVPLFKCTMSRKLFARGRPWNRTCVLALKRMYKYLMTRAVDPDSLESRSRSGPSFLPQSGSGFGSGSRFKSVFGLDPNPDWQNPGSGSGLKWIRIHNPARDDKVGRPENMRNHARLNVLCR
jgi:hypothetical protein